MDSYYYNADIWVPFKAIQEADRKTPVTAVAYDDIKVFYGEVHKTTLTDASTVTGGGATWTELVLTGVDDFYEKSGPGAATGDYIFKFPATTFTGLSTVLYHVEVEPAFGTPFLVWSDRFSLSSSLNPLYQSNDVDAKLDALITAITTGETGSTTALGLMTRCYNYLYGSWKLEEAQKQWSVRAPITNVEEARFNLLDQFGNPTATPTRIFERVKV